MTAPTTRRHFQNTLAPQGPSTHDPFPLRACATILDLTPFPANYAYLDTRTKRKSALHFLKIDVCSPRIGDQVNVGASLDAGDAAVQGMVRMIGKASMGLMQVLDGLGRASETADGDGRSAGNGSRSMLIVIGALLFLQLFVLFYIGPVHSFDSQGYVLYGDLMLHERGWLHSADLNVSPARAPQLRDNLGPEVITTVRLPLYPALLAAAKLSSERYYDYIVGLVQIVVAMAAYASLFLAARRSGVPIAAVTIAVLLYGMSASVLYNVTIMTDSLFANLLILIVSILTYYLAAWERLPYRVALILGMLALLAVFLRDTGYPIILVVTAFVFFSEAVKARTVLRAGLVSALLLLPSAAGLEIYKNWNEYRTGERFVTVLSTSLLRTVLYLELSGIAVLPEGAPRRALEDVIGTETQDGTCVIEDLTIARRAFSHTSLRRLSTACAEAMHDALLQDHGMDNVEIGALSRDGLARSLRLAPQGLIGFALAESLSKAPMDIISFDHWFSIVTDRQFDQQVSIRTTIKKLANDPANFVNIADLLVEIFSRIISIFLFVVFMIFVTMALCLAIKRHGSLRPPEWCLALHLLVVSLLIVGHSVILIETRYILSAQAFIILDALFVIWILKTGLLTAHREGVAR